MLREVPEHRIVRAKRRKMIIPVASAYSANHSDGWQYEYYLLNKQFIFTYLNS